MMRELVEARARELEEGTAQLLALHSGRPLEVAETIRLIREADGDLRSEAFFLRLMDHFGMVAEAAEERTWVLRPDDVASVVLPEMPAEGMTVTADRARALAREDVGFLTVDHPLWQAALDALLGSEDGNACLAVAEGGVAAAAADDRRATGAAAAAPSLLCRQARRGCGGGGAPPAGAQRVLPLARGH